MRIAGVGCSLADYLYREVDFSSEAFAELRSRERGDGGLEPGRLVFLEGLEKFSGLTYQQAIQKLVGDKEPDTLNVGGPSVVALILAAQLLKPRGMEVSYFGVVGDDKIGRDILEIVRQTPLNVDNYQVISGRSPFTMVLSDPNYDEGHGERAFVNNIGTSWHYGPKDIPEKFFKSDIVLFGATAIVPQLHDNLTGLVKKAKEKGCCSVVSTVYDFRNEMKNPGGKWPLGESEQTYQYTDLLIVDKEEALSISGQDRIEKGCDYFISNKLGAFIITQGPNEVIFYSNGELFAKCEIDALPVSKAAGERMAAEESRQGDTTGCGDNFVGGVLSSLAGQLSKRKKGEMKLQEAVATGICAGGSALFHLGGMMIEKEPGEKAAEIEKMYQLYREQVKGKCTLGTEFLG